MTIDLTSSPLWVTDEEGGRITYASASGDPPVIAFDAEQAIDGATAKLFRYLHDYERTSARSPETEEITSEDAVTVDAAGTVATVTINTRSAGETYRVVAIFDSTSGTTFVRYRALVVDD